MEVNLVDVVAVVVAGLALAIATVQNLRLARANRQLEEAVFLVERNLSYEGLLVDHPDLLKFYGIELPEDSDVSGKDVAFMLLSYNAFRAYCKARNLDERKHLATSDYRRRLFSSKAAQAAWKYARFCTSKQGRAAIDDFIRWKPQLEEPEPLTLGH